MAVADLHPPAEALAAFTLGVLADETGVSVAAHLAGCESCQARAAAVPGDPLVELLRRAHAGPGVLANTGPQTETPAPLTAESPTVTLDSDASPSDPTAMTAAVPPELARHERYHLGRVLGAGGMGVVYAAEHRVLKRPVALKVINRAYTANAAAVERFRGEVRAAACLSHPNVVATHDAEDAGGLQLMVMELVEGVSLAQMVKEQGPLPVALACDVVRQAALGLQHAHERGMVHRDVKPANLIRCPDGTVKVIDFGLAALTADRDGKLTDANVVMGTPDYMAPEQAADPRTADIRADVYSLGCTLFHLLTGRVPYPESTPVLRILAHRERPVPSARRLRPEIPAGLDAVVRRMMARNPKDRLATPADVAAALEPFTRPAGPAPRRNRPLLFAALFAGLLVATGVVYRVQTDKGELVITTESDDVEVIVRQGGKVVRIIDTQTDKQITLSLRSGEYELELKGAPEGLKLDIGQVTLTRDGTALARIERVAKPPTTAPQTVADDKPGEVRRHPWGFGGQTYSHVISPDNQFYLASGGPVETVRVWNMRTGEQAHEFKGAFAFFTPDGKQVITGGWPCEFRLYDLATGKLVRSFGSTEHLWMCRLSPDGKWVCGRTGASRLRVWEVATGKERHVISGEKTQELFLFTTDGKRLAYSTDGKPWKSRDLDTGEESAIFEAGLGQKHLLAFLPGGKEVLGYSETGIQFRDAGTGKIIREFSFEEAFDIPPWKPGQPPAYGTGYSYSADSLSADGQRLLVRGPDGPYRLLDLTTGKVITRLDIPDGKNPTPAGISPDGRYATGLGDDGKVFLWRLPDPKPVSHSGPGRPK